MGFIFYSQNKGPSPEGLHDPGGEERMGRGKFETTNIVAVGVEFETRTIYGVWLEG
jgi:hypothetical protein